MKRSIICAAVGILSSLALLAIPSHAAPGTAAPTSRPAAKSNNPSAKPGQKGELLKDNSSASGAPKKFVPATKEESDAAIEDAKKFGDEVAKKLDVTFATIETPHFIIFTDWD